LADMLSRLQSSAKKVRHHDALPYSELPEFLDLAPSWKELV
jgi:hypothetical protein